jgi:hypothetical protein
VKGKGVTKMKDGMYESATEALEAIRTLDAERKARKEARTAAHWKRNGITTAEEAQDWYEGYLSARQGW